VTREYICTLVFLNG